jgi:hypothetical protein
MNCNRLTVATSLLTGALMTSLFAQAAYAQSAHISAYSAEAVDDSPDGQPATQTGLATAPNIPPTDLLGNIWKRANPPNAGTGSKERGVSDANAPVPSPKLPVADVTAAAK